MPKRRRLARIPTPAWDRPRSGPLSRLRRELGPRAYLLAGIVGLVIVAGLVIIFAFVQDYREEQARAGSAAITVGDRTYNLDYFARRLSLFNRESVASSALAAVGFVGDQIIDEETARRFASELGVSVTDDDVDNEIADGVGRSQGNFNDEEYRQIVEAQLLAQRVREKLTEDIPPDVEQVNYRQIAVATEEEARQVIDRLEAGEDFAELAREVSLDTQTRASGGDRGWVAKGGVAPVLEETLFALEPGAYSEPFQPPINPSQPPSSSGFFVFQVVEKEVRPLEDSQRALVELRAYQRWLEEKQQSLAINDYVSVGSGQFDPEKYQWVVEHAQGG